MISQGAPRCSASQPCHRSTSFAPLSATRKTLCFPWGQGMGHQAHFPGEKTEAPTDSETPPQSNNLG